jgi:uncharacterized protein YfaA (DUF2138 family)
MSWPEVAMAAVGAFQVIALAYIAAGQRAGAARGRRIERDVHKLNGGSP